jgi:hypothetical protein
MAELSKQEKILMAYKRDRKFNRKHLAQEIGCCQTYVTDVLRQARRSGIVDFNDFVTNKGSNILEGHKAKANREERQMGEITDNIDSLLVETKGREVRTAEQACDYCGVDLDKYKIDRKIVNFWDMGKKRNWQVKVWLSPILETDTNEVIKRLIERLPNFKYREQKPMSVKRNNNSGNLGVIANFDAHIGKLAWDVETSQGDYDLPIAIEEFNHVTDENLKRVQMFDPEKLIFILGQDMMHYENLEGVTPVGRNILDTDGRLSKLQDAAIDVCVRNILKCRALAPVKVILVQGNHDGTSSLWLSKVLRAWFRNDDHVEIDCRPVLRKAELWGTTFIGFTHKIPPSKIAAAQADFSIQFKELWGKAEYREILFGDQHKKMQWKTGSQITHGAILFRQLTALSKIDYWHYEHMFTDAVPGGEAFVYSKDHGCIANFTEWTFHLTNKRKK